MSIKFQQIYRVSRSVKTVHTNIFANNRKLHKFATTNSIFFKNRHFQTCIIVKYTCISIYNKIRLVDLSKPCTQIYLQKKCINLQLAIRILKKRFSDMYYPLTDIQVDFKINWLIRYQITAERKYI